MMKKQLLFILFILSASVTAYAQIVQGGNEIFTKSFVINTPDISILQAEHDAFDGNQLLYFDSNNNIRKYISDFEYPDSRFLIGTTYNKFIRQAVAPYEVARSQNILKTAIRG